MMRKKKAARRNEADQAEDTHIHQPRKENTELSLYITVTLTKPSTLCVVP